MNTNHLLRIAAFLAVLSSSSCSKTSQTRQPKTVPAEPQTRWPRNSELEVRLTVLHALEGGPFVCKVELKNISKRTLNYAIDNDVEGATCHVAANWSANKEPLNRVGIRCGLAGPFLRELSPEASASHTFYLHQSFLEVPAGDVPVGFGWDVYRTKKSTTKGSAWRGEELELLFSLKRTQTVKVMPATKENLAQVLRCLEADFTRATAAVAGRRDYHWASPDPAADFVQTLAACRRKEFIPLLIRAMNQLPGAQHRREFIATIYESSDTSEEGFHVLADYLASPRPAAAVEVFQYWHQEEIDHKDSARRQVELRNKKKQTGDAEQDQVEQFMRDATRADEEAWRTSKRHLDTRLMKKQFNQLLAVKNVWVRALLYAYFSDRCPTDWVRGLLADLLKVTRPPDRLLKLMDQLDDDNFQVREQATRELTDGRNAFVAYFGTAPKGSFSLEASHRLRQILEGVGEPELPPLWRRTIAHLAWSDKPQSRQMLDILRTADSPNLITRTAQDAFEERKKHDEKMKQLERFAHALHS